MKEERRYGLLNTRDCATTPNAFLVLFALFLSYTTPFQKFLSYLLSLLHQCFPFRVSIDALN